MQRSADEPTACAADDTAADYAYIELRFGAHSRARYLIKTLSSRSPWSSKMPRPDRGSPE